MASQKGREWGDRARTSPLALGVVGGTVGAIVGMALRRREQEHLYDYPRYEGSWRYDERGIRQDAGWNEGYGEAAYYGESTSLPPTYGATDVDVSSDEPALRDRAGAKLGDLKEGVSEKAAHVKERVSHAVDNLRGGTSHAMDNLRGGASHLRERASHLRERVPSRDELSYRARSYYHDSVDNQPLLLVAGALVLGAVASLVIPVTDKERRAIGPVRERAKEQIASVTSEVKEKLQNVGERVKSEVKDAVGSSPRDERSAVEENRTDYGSTTTGPGSTIPELPPLH